MSDYFFLSGVCFSVVMTIVLIVPYMVSSFVVITLAREVKLSYKAPYTVILAFKAFSMLNAAQIFVDVVTNTAD